MTRELQYYLHDDPDAFRLELSGSLNGASAESVHHAWRTALSILRNRIAIVDVTFLREVDVQGRALLRLWHRNGARIVARSQASRVLAEEIVGEPIPTPSTRPGWWQRLTVFLRRPAAAAGSLIRVQFIWGIKAENNAQVDDFYQAAIAAGAKANISPRARLEYYPGYYAADVLDPDGYSFEVVHKS